MARSLIPVKITAIRLMGVCLAAVLWFTLAAWPHAPSHAKDAGIWPMRWPVFQIGRAGADTAYGWPFYYGYSQNDVYTGKLFDISGAQSPTNMVLAWMFWGLIVWGGFFGGFYWSSRIDRRKKNMRLKMHVSS